VEKKLLNRRLVFKDFKKLDLIEIKFIAFFSQKKTARTHSHTHSHTHARARAHRK